MLHDAEFFSVTECLTQCLYKYEGTFNVGVPVTANIAPVVMFSEKLMWICSQRSNISLSYFVLRGAIVADVVLFSEEQKMPIVLRGAKLPSIFIGAAPCTPPPRSSNQSSFPAPTPPEFHQKISTF